MGYGNFTKEELGKAVGEIFQEYKDPTRGMTLAQKEMFHKEMKKQAKEWTYSE